MSPEVLASIGVSALTGLCGVWAARSARRTPRQEKRDDFTTIRDSLQGQIDGMKVDLVQQRESIGDQEQALAWLLSRVRVLASYIRERGMEPPAPAPMSERARKYIHHIDG